MNTDSADDIVVVLDRPQDSVNIGAVVRAIKNMGFSQLRLVSPRPYAHFELARVAHHAEDVIAAIEVYPTLAAALADTVYVVGTAAVAHPGRPLRRDIEPLCAELVQRSAAGKVALLFGTEDDGLDAVALDRCHSIATLPTNPVYSALNLAQSVLLFLYEIARQANRLHSPGGIPAGANRAAPQMSGAEPAVAPEARSLLPQAALEQLFTLTEQALAELGFFKYNPDAVMRTLRQLAYRAELQPQEAALLMAVARQAIYTARRSLNPNTSRNAQPNAQPPTPPSPPGP